LGTGFVLGGVGMLPDLAPELPGELVRTKLGKIEPFFAPGRAASRAGTPPAVRTFGDQIFAVVARNIGDELHRLSEKNDRSTVSRLLPCGVDLTKSDADDERVYAPADGKVVALNCETLRESWRSTLPELESVRWQIRVGKTTLIVCPTEAVQVESWSAVSSVRGVANHPNSLRLLGTAGGLFDAATRFVFPVLILDPATGKQLQRFDVPTLGPTVTVMPRTDGLLVASTGRAVWLGKK